MIDHPIHWLYQQFVDFVPETRLRCYLCGAFAAEARYPVARCLADTFNSHYLARAPSSSSLCAACAWYFDSHAGHPDFRKMSLVVLRDGWVNWPREQMKSDLDYDLVRGIERDCYLIVSLSKKKHILLQAPCNTAGSHSVRVQVEEQGATLTAGLWRDMNTSFSRLLALGHGKGEILSGNLYANTLRKHGQIAEAMRLSDELSSYRGGAALELLSYVTIVEKETNDAGSGDGDDPAGGALAQSRLDGDRPGVQIEVPHGHLDAVRDKRRGLCQDEQHTAGISQQTLF